ncbi:A/G-specific adenine glycosylase [Salidesulfovibrio brasiliensis]|uniref:A/G-specific adenine glycosylase n=1 Tax=Salidesulfovibrio brasiliensis TaxID=221711 RepID=UPI0006D12C83|nr:A/G-specific adenine glycosylase [Salidesulfovibrio brasiliensis]
MDTNAFTQALLDWFDANRRDLPWRKGYDPYHVWMSEIMAQQTQMDRVVPYFRRWMERFPDIRALAGADEETVLKLWEGLGYYSRAKNVLKAARLVVENHDGRFPDSLDAIRELPGVGEYTAGAIASIAFNLPEPCIDANVMRVFARMDDLSLAAGTGELKREAERLVRSTMPEDRPRDFNQALMELGALVCRKKPLCDLCPVQPYCAAHEANVVWDRPLPKAKKGTVRIEMVTGVLVHEGRVLIQKRRPDDVWPGLWEFPGGVMEEGESPEETLVREYREETELSICPEEKITVVRYAYTRFRVTMHCYLCSCPGDPAPVFHEATEGCFVAPSALSEYAFPSGHRKLLQCMEQDIRFATLLIR